MMKRVISKVLCFLLIASMLASPIESQAADRVLTLSMAKISALANDDEYAKLENQLELKKVSRVQALKSIKLKEKNMRTFRWTPLLSFKFPEKPNLSEAYEFQYKPIQLQAEIDTLNHQLTDQVFSIYETVSNLYVDIVTLIDTIEFNEARMLAMEKTLAKNRPRLQLGLATKSDIEKMEKDVKTLSEKIATDKGNLEAKKKKLSDSVGMDVSTGYRFINPMVDATIPRSELKNLIQYTLDRDQSYYDASMNVTTGLISLDTNYQLMEGQYGGKMNYISGFVNQAKAGQKVDGSAFRKKYDEFLKAIDQPWAGSIKILFIKIPKEWFKGQISGIRYVEDEPYALYEAVLEYQNFVIEKESMKKSMSQSVEDGFNNLINMRNSYMSLVNQVSDAKEGLEADEILNRIGELTYEEYKTSLDDYESLQNEMYTALSSYTQQLYSYDRLTCGGITAYLEGIGVHMSSDGGGVSNVEAEVAEGATYYIDPIIQEMEFRIGINIPEEFEIEITDFELWCDNVQIGKRTPADEAIRHLALSVDDVKEVKIRLYNGDEFVDDCIIDPDVFNGPLDIVKSYTAPTVEDNEIGTYTMDSNAVTGIVTIKLEADEDEEIAYYLIKNQDGKYLVGDTMIAIEEGFKYLSIVQTNIEDLIIEFYGRSSDLKYTGYFDTVNEKLMKNPEEV